MLFVAHVLLVEDNAIALQILERIIAQAGLKSTSAVDGESALTLAKTHQFDLIITDIGLPGISGYELTKAIRHWENENQLKPAPIIGLTAHPLHEVIDRCLRAGMYTVLSKPINLKAIEQLIQQYQLYQPAAHLFSANA